MKRIVVVLAVLLGVLLAALFSTSGTTTPEYPEIPLSVDQVETYRIAGQLVRVVRHNMELMPQIDIELLATPSVELIDAISIGAITVEGEVLEFATADGVFVEGIQARGNAIAIELDYYYSGGGSDLITCLITVKQASFGELMCRK